jgi:N-acetylneuraminate synthase
MAVKIVAEIGGNHNGDINLALALCTAAKEVGADVVKFQTRTPEIAIPLEQQQVPKETPWGTMTYLEYRKKLELRPTDYESIDRHCNELGIEWTTSVWDVPAFVGITGQFHSLPFIKIPSACLTDDALLEAVGGVATVPSSPVVISTGMSTMEEIRHAVYILRSAPLTICHCNSTYPSPKQDLNLRCIQTLRETFDLYEIGYSGHEVGLATTVAAVALGATYIERHITLDRSMWGTDQAASVEPQGFKRLVDDIRSVEVALGDGVKRVTEGELAVKRKLRKA